MTQDVYNRIIEYCTTKYDGVLVQVERDFVLRNFLDCYFAAIEEQTRINQKPLTKEQQETILNSLLTDSIMNDNITLAKKYYEDLQNTMKSDFEKQQNKVSILKEIAISIFSNFIYSIILIIVFWVAKDQLSSWLSQLIS